MALKLWICIKSRHCCCCCC